MTEEAKRCYVCGQECEGGWGWILFEFWDFPHPAFYKLEQAVVEIEKKPLCRQHLVEMFQIARDFVRSGGDMDAFLKLMEARHED